MLPAGPALLALLALALSGMVAQYGLYLGSDMPFAACVSLCLAALLLGLRDPPAAPRPAALLAAGLLGGAAFLMRHLGVLLLPWGVLACLGLAWLRGDRSWRLARPAAIFGAGFLLAAAPQIGINLAQTGNPLYNQQAKNIWLAVYGGTDWGRWDEAPNSVTLADVLLGDPARFLGNWWRNLVGYMGSGAEDTSEFGRANQLRLLGWPANWLAVGGLVAWLARVVRRGGAAGGGGPDGHGAAPRAAALLGLIALYVAAVGTAFTLQRFFLPLAPIYAAAAAWAAWRLAGGGRRLLGVGMALVVVLWGGWSAGAGYVLRNQPADELSAVRMVETAAPPGALIAARVAARLPLAKYSAIAHRAVNWPAGADPARILTAADLAGPQAAGASYLLWDEAAGPPPLPSPAAARVATSGRYGLYRLGP
jgi:4-amino-4-deoxy-L-arabinose transferase-like glycosyltransferase